MRKWLGIFVLFLAVILVGCSGGGGSDISGNGAAASSASTASAAVPAGAGTTLTGVVPGVQGARIEAFHLRPSGALGEAVDPSEPATAFPVPRPDPIATAQQNSDGSFSLTLPDGRPVVVQVVGGTGPAGTSGSGLEAAVIVPAGSNIRITAFSTMAAIASRTSMSGGEPVTSAIERYNGSLAAYLGLENLLAATTADDSRILTAEIEGLYRQATALGVDPVDFISKLGDDLVDGIFNGLDGSAHITVASRNGGAINLPATAMTAGLGGAMQSKSVDSVATGLKNSSGGVTSPAQKYVSPYSVKFTAPSLTDDFQVSPRSDLSFQSVNPPFSEWYSLKYWGQDNRGIESERTWGPTPNTYPLPNIPQVLPAGMSVADWKRQRLVATAYHYQGLLYRHHHIPGWSPPASWPYGEPGAYRPGLDCSDFSSWHHNFGLGIHLKTGVKTQAEETTVSNSNGTFTAEVPLKQTVRNQPVEYSEFKKKLKPGDLLYIRGKVSDAPGENITHVIMWVGDLGHGSRNGVPLVIDSHGPVVHDENGKLIPGGVYLRPFYEHSWYHNAFDHAHRWVHDTPSPSPGNSVSVETTHYAGSKTAIMTTIGGGPPVLTEVDTGSDIYMVEEEFVGPNIRMTDKEVTIKYRHGTDPRTGRVGYAQLTLNSGGKPVISTSIEIPVVVVKKGVVNPVANENHAILGLRMTSSVSPKLFLPSPYNEMVIVNRSKGHMRFGRLTDDEMSRFGLVALQSPGCEPDKGIDPPQPTGLECWDDSAIPVRYDISDAPQNPTEWNSLFDSGASTTFQADPLPHFFHVSDGRLTNTVTAKLATSKGDMEIQLSSPPGAANVSKDKTMVNVGNHVFNFYQILYDQKHGRFGLAPP